MNMNKGSLSEVLCGILDMEIGADASEVSAHIGGGVPCEYVEFEVIVLFGLSPRCFKGMLAYGSFF